MWIYFLIALGLIWAVIHYFKYRSPAVEAPQPPHSADTDFDPIAHGQHVSQVTDGDGSTTADVHRMTL